MVSSVTSLSSLRHHPRGRYRQCRGSLVLPKHKQVRDTGRADRDKPTRECDRYHESEASIIQIDSLRKTVTLIRNSAGTEPSAGSWARKPDKHAGLVGQLSQVEQQTLRLKLLT